MSENDTLSPESVLDLSYGVHPPSEPEDERHRAEPIDSNVDNADVLEAPISGEAQANNANCSDPTLPLYQYDSHNAGLLDQSGQLDSTGDRRMKRKRATPSSPSGNVLVPSIESHPRRKMQRSRLSSITADQAKPNVLITGAPLRDRPARPPYPESPSSRERNASSSTTSNSGVGKPSSVIGSSISTMAGNLRRKRKTNGHEMT